MKNLLRNSGLLSLIIFTHAFAQTLPPKREFRGAWISTVANIDWPSSPFLSPQSQRNELIRILDELKEAGINAVIFQIRPECDALYASTIEPWSYWLTGGQGMVPNPFYDPLEFAIQETRKRGMELHTWFNPYRAVRVVVGSGSYPNASNHVSVKHPDWVIQIGNYKFLDPGLPMVRDYVVSVIMDVVRRYDIDGAHMDDYFYPDPPNTISNQDDKTFANYSRGFTNRGDWRRDNVNLLIKMINDSIQTAKPYVKFGMSPRGIWKNGVPPGIVGQDNYSVIYCDAVAWLNQKTIDYLVPQLYWPFGGGQDYGKLLPWWAAQMNGRHLYPGQAAYRIADWTANEMSRQIRLNRNTSNVIGSIFFTAHYFRDNPKGFTDSLKTNLYLYPALSPVMAWKDAIPPNVPVNLRYERIAGTGTAELRWNEPPRAGDGNVPSRYVVYRFDKPIVTPADRDDPTKIIAIAGDKRQTPKAPLAGNSYYAVTALDRVSNESDLSPTVRIFPPAMPLLALPGNGASDLPESIALRWLYPPVAASYQLQVAADSTFFSQVVVNEANLVDTAKVISGLEGQRTYFWRVKAGNPGGNSGFSMVYSFTTGFPAAPLLAYPPNNTPNIPLNGAFKWNAGSGAQTYQVQLSRSLTFDSTAIVLAAKGINDTVYAFNALESNRFYFWRVRATNTIGTSLWSAVSRFRTLDVTSVVETPAVPATFALYQNYPNPFNPLTKIVFDLPKPGPAQLIVYDALGQEMATLLNEPKSAGRHEVSFYAYDFPSGIYYYRLKFEGQVLTRRMTILK